MALNILGTYFRTCLKLESRLKLQTRSPTLERATRVKKPVNNLDSFQLKLESRSEIRALGTLGDKM